MNIHKSQILDLLRSQGDDDKAERADQELPDRSTPTATAGCSASSGLDIGSLMRKFGGGSLGKLLS